MTIILTKEEAAIVLNKLANWLTKREKAQSQFAATMTELEEIRKAILDLPLADSFQDQRREREILQKLEELLEHQYTTVENWKHFLNREIKIIRAGRRRKFSPYEEEAEEAAWRRARTEVIC